MEANRESLICIKSEHYKETENKFLISLKLDFGKTVCKEKMENIKAAGYEPSNNCVVIFHEFDTVEAAASLVKKIEDFKAGGMLGPVAELYQPPKVEGKKVHFCCRLPPPAIEPLGMLEAVAASMGDFVDKHQYIEFTVANSHSIKDIMGDFSVTPIANLLQAMCFKLKISTQKHLPAKILNFVAEMGPESQKEKFKMLGEGLSSFNHLRLEMELSEPSQTMKDQFKNEILQGLVMGAQMVVGMATQFELMEIAKQGGVKTKATLCLSPMISIELSIEAPTAIETLEKLVSPEVMEKLQ